MTGNKGECHTTVTVPYRLPDGAVHVVHSALQQLLGTLAQPLADIASVNGVAISAVDVEISGDLAVQWVLDEMGDAADAELSLGVQYGSSPRSSFSSPSCSPALTRTSSRSTSCASRSEDEEGPCPSPFPHGCDFYLASEDFQVVLNVDGSTLHSVITLQGALAGRAAGAPDRSSWVAHGIARAICGLLPTVLGLEHAAAPPSTADSPVPTAHSLYEGAHPGANLLITRGVFTVRFLLPETHPPGSPARLTTFDIELPLDRHGGRSTPTTQ